MYKNYTAPLCAATWRWTCWKYLIHCLLQRCHACGQTSQTTSQTVRSDVRNCFCSFFLIFYYQFVCNENKIVSFSKIVGLIVVLKYKQNSFSFKEKVRSPRDLLIRTANKRVTIGYNTDQIIVLFIINGCLFVCQI